MKAEIEYMSDGTPRTYLSTSDGKWSVIHQGDPLCPRCEKAEALAVWNRWFAGCVPQVWHGFEDKPGFFAAF